MVISEEAYLRSQPEGNRQMVNSSQLINLKVNNFFTDSHRFLKFHPH